jgi:hypothetical protein
MLLQREWECSFISWHIGVVIRT